MILQWSKYASECKCDGRFADRQANTAPSLPLRL